MQPVSARRAPREVSIRARLVGRAMPVSTTTTWSVNPFQSAPGWLAGRCTDLYSGHGILGEVSIRARLVGRAMRVWSLICDTFLRCFNPRPAGWPGDATTCSRHPEGYTGFNPRPAGWPGDAGVAHANQVDALIVSIRARLVGRAMQAAMRTQVDALIVSIRARLVGRAMP